MRSSKSITDSREPIQGGSVIKVTPALSRVLRLRGCVRPCVLQPVDLSSGEGFGGRVWNPRSAEEVLKAAVRFSE